MSVLKDGKSFYDHDRLSDILAENLRRLYEYGLIQKGAYTVETSGTLQKAYDPRFGGAGRVYEGLGASWVWQSGVSVPAGYTQPFQVSGVYVDNTFYPTTASGTYSYIVDYENGRVIFDSDITSGGSSSPVVKCNYVFNDVAIYLSDDPQWKTIQGAYFERFSNIGQMQPSGLGTTLKDRRVWLPSFVIQVDERGEARGLSLGGGDIHDFNTFYHIFAEQPYITKTLSDIINNQYNVTMKLYDISTAPHPYNFNGSLSSGAIEYPNLATTSSPHFLTFARVDSSRGGAKGNWEELYVGEIRSVIEVDRGVNSFGTQ